MNNQDNNPIEQIKLANNCYRSFIHDNHVYSCGGCSLQSYCKMNKTGLALLESLFIDDTIQINVSNVRLSNLQ